MSSDARKAAPRGRGKGRRERQPASPAAKRRFPAGVAALASVRIRTRRGWWRHRALGFAAIAAIHVLAAPPTAASHTLGLHAALEGRAGYADDDSRWRRAGDRALYDVAATVRPLYSGVVDSFSFQAEVEVDAMLGDTAERSAVGVDLAPGVLDRALFDLSRTWSRGRRHRHTARVDRLSAAWSPSWGVVTVGRHAVTWGGGLVFNPFDLFNPFAPGDVIRDYKIGADMIHVDVPLADGGLQLLAVGRRDPITDSIAAHASSFAALWQRQLGGGGEAALMAASHYDEPAFGAGLAGLLGEATWRIDGTWVRVRPPGSGTTEAYFAAVANLQYSWIWSGKNVFGFLEYHHNGLGHSDPRSGLNDPYLLTQIGRGNVFLLGRDYLAASLQVEWHPLVNAFLSVIVNVRDPSALVQPRVTWNASNRLQVLIGADLPVGATGTEFGGFDPGDGLGTTRPPASFYLRATWDW